MSLPASDTFTRADAGNLGGNWTFSTPGGGGDLNISSHVCICTVGALRGAWWTADSFNTNHYSQVTCPDVTIGYGGPCVRMQTAGGSFDGYWLVFNKDDGHVYIQRIDVGVNTTLTDCGNVATSGMVLKLSINGSTLTAYKNGSSIGTATDSTYVGGAAGIALALSNASLDDWSADDVSGGGGGGTVGSIFYRHVAGL